MREKIYFHETFHNFKSHSFSIKHLIISKILTNNGYVAENRPNVGLDQDAELQCGSVEEKPKPHTGLRSRLLRKLTRYGIILSA